MQHGFDPPMYAIAQSGRLISLFLRCPLTLTAHDPFAVLTSLDTPE